MSRTVCVADSNAQQPTARFFEPGPLPVAGWKFDEQDSTGSLFTVSQIKAIGYRAEYSDIASADDFTRNLRCERPYKRVGGCNFVFPVFSAPQSNRYRLLFLLAGQSYECTFHFRTHQGTNQGTK